MTHPRLERIRVVLRHLGDEPSRGQSVVEFALVLPIMVILLFGILDFSRIYTTMMSVESAAREAADYSTSFGADRWSSSNVDTTVAEMKRRACLAASDLPDYAGIDLVAPYGMDEDCSNPSFAYCVTQTTGGSCDYPIVPTDPSYTCDQPERDPPCTVTVTLRHVFHLIVPFHLDIFGVQLGLPDTLTFERDSTFAMTDIDVAPSTSP